MYLFLYIFIYWACTTDIVKLVTYREIFEKDADLQFFHVVASGAPSIGILQSDHFDTAAVLIPVAIEEVPMVALQIPNYHGTV